MPYGWLAPQLRIRTDKVSIYMAYKDDAYNHPRHFWFTVNEADTMEDAYDIRDWPEYNSDDEIETNLLNAVLAGDITKEGVSWEKT